MRRMTWWVLAPFLGSGGILSSAQTLERPVPTFTLSVEKDNGPTRFDSGRHTILVHFKRIAPGSEVDMFNPEEEGMYDMIVLHDGKPVPETAAMRDLRDYRKADNDHSFPHPRLLKTGETWTTPLDLSDYYDMSRPGVYEVTVVRESMPLNLAYSTLVRSNTISIVVPETRTLQEIPESKKPKPRFDLTISLDDPGNLSPLIVRVERTNRSEHTIRERKCWTFMGMYNLEVQFDGEHLEPNNSMKQLQQNRARVDCNGNETLKEIEPGEYDADDIPVSNFFDLSRPGAYVVYITRETFPWNPGKSVKVQSNPLSFVIPEPVSDAGAGQGQIGPN